MGDGGKGVMPDINDIIRFENGEMDEDETREFLQGLVDSGVILQLQGFYGRAAHAMGLI